MFLPEAPENKNENLIEAAFDRFYRKMGTGPSR